MSVGVVDVGPARDSVSEARIRLWCDALEDRNPTYCDPAAAAAGRFGGIVAPPAMLETWTMPPLTHPEPGVPRPLERDEFGEVRRLRRAGFVAALSTDAQQRYVRYLRPGDRIAKRWSVVEVSEHKRTQVGDGHFVTLDAEYRDQNGLVVGEQRMRHLFFRPAGMDGVSGSPGAAPERSDSPPIEDARSPAVGAALPSLTLELTATRVIASAFAAGDHHLAHHDRDFARSEGLRDVFMSILATNGFVSRYATDWSGPDSEVESIALRLGAPACAGDVLVLEGRIVGVVPEATGVRVTLEVRARLASPAPHAVATVVVSFPPG